MSERRRATLSVAGLALAAACGSEQKPPADGRSPMPPSVAVMAPDTMKQRIDSTNAARKADSIARVQLRVRKTPPDSRLRDSAFGPKLELDSTGKVRPVKPPKRPDD
jgi:hypothetical protein